MKSIPLALLVCTASIPAAAQSSVTLFGLMDTAVSNYSSKSERPSGETQRLSRTALTTGGYSASRLGFRGTEDLGGGLAAGFWLEMPLVTDDGSGTGAFTRRSTVSLSGTWGEIRLGRDYTPTFWNDTVFDPFVTNGSGQNLIYSAGGFNTNGGTGGFGGNTTNARSSNAVQYFLPAALGGVYGQFMYAMDEQIRYDSASATPAASTRAGRYVGARVGYAKGPVEVAVAYGETITGGTFGSGTKDTVSIANVGASYDFGAVKLFTELSQTTFERDQPSASNTSDADLTGYLVGFSMPVGPGLIRAAYSHVKYDLKSSPVDPEAGKLSVGYIHNLSKRTAIYTTVARIRNRNDSALAIGGLNFVRTGGYVPTTATGFDVGIRHAF